MPNGQLNKMISFDKEKLDLFKSAYDQAVALKQDNFLFDSNHYDIGYAKYLIEYLNMQFKINNQEDKSFKRKP